MNEPKLKRKETITDKAIKKQKGFLIVAIFCVVTLLISSSYALLTNFDKTDNVINFTTGNLEVTLTNSGNSLTLTELNGKLPESDTNGLNNATPITLTLTNTGTMFIDGYEVKLVSDKNQTSTLDDEYIKYSISEDGTTYTSPNILANSGNIVYKGHELSVDASKTIYLKVWIDESAGNNALNKEYYGSIKVDLYQKYSMSDSIKSSAIAKENSASSCSNLTIEEDGITYLSGTNECIDFNYVWYSGKLWRITAIYPDGSMKMITDNVMTTIYYGEDNVFYADEENNSYIYQWLNEDFLETLYDYKNIIKTDSIWNATSSNANETSEVSKKIGQTTLVNSYVGLLNSYEYYKSNENSDTYTSGFLYKGYTWWLINPYNDTDIWRVHYDGNCNNLSIGATGGVRPSVILSSANAFEGSGTKLDPYTIKNDKENDFVNSTKLNTRSSGEYVNFDNELYRIVFIENNGTIKLNKLDYIKNGNNGDLSKYFSSNLTYGSGTNDTYWDYYLNNIWYNNISKDYRNMLVEGIYYIGTVGTSNKNYKAGVCANASNLISIRECIANNQTTINTWKGYVGLPRYGEMFASQLGDGYLSSSSNMWLITVNDNPFSNWYVSNGGVVNYNVGVVNNVRPSIYLSASVKIISGNGTKQRPFEISL